MFSNSISISLTLQLAINELLHHIGLWHPLKFRHRTGADADKLVAQIVAYESLGCRTKFINLAFSRRFAARCGRNNHID